MYAGFPVEFFSNSN